jgi:lipoprotein signal peptidase
MPPDYMPALCQALQLGDLNGAADCVKQRFQVTIRFQYSANENQPFSVIRLDFKDGNGIDFSFCKDLNTHPRSEFVITRTAASILLFVSFLTRKKAESASTFFNVEDHRVWPGLSFCDYGEDTFLLPDPVYIMTAGYKDIASYFETNPIAWNDRKLIGFWRGSTTGRLHDVPSWEHLPRIRLCSIGASRPDLFDIGVTSIIGGLESNTDDIRERGYVKDYIPDNDYQQYRFHIDIDGNSNSWPGLFTKLLTGSPVLKVASSLNFKQWYYDRLKPWVNFVPVSADMHDLTQRLEWLSRHEAAAQDIGEAGRRLAQNLTLSREIEASNDAILAALRKSNAITESIG